MLCFRRSEWVIPRIGTIYRLPWPSLLSLLLMISEHFHGSLLNHYERKEDSKSVKKIKERKSRTYKAKMAEAEYTPVTRKNPSEHYIAWCKIVFLQWIYSKSIHLSDHMHPQNSKSRLVYRCRKITLKGFYPRSKNIIENGCVKWLYLDT